MDGERGGRAFAPERRALLPHMLTSNRLHAGWTVFCCSQAGALMGRLRVNLVTRLSYTSGWLGMCWLLRGQSSWLKRLGNR